MPRTDGPWLLVDGNNVASRALHAASRNEMSVGDQPTGTLTLFINMLTKYARETNPSMITVAWDKGYEGRTQAFAGYKANRPPKEPEHRPAGVRSEWDMIKDFLVLNNIEQQSVPGWEADDVIAVACRRDVGVPKVIVSGDKDLLQLIQRDGSVTQIKVPDATLWTAEHYDSVMGWPVEKAPLMHALVGDTSDGIPGLYGIGKVKAKKMLDAADWDWDTMLTMLDPADEETAKVMLELVDLRDREYPPALAQLVFARTSFTGTPVDEDLFAQWLDSYRMESVTKAWRAGTLWTALVGEGAAPDTSEALFADIV